MNNILILIIVIMFCFLLLSVIKEFKKFNNEIKLLDKHYNNLLSINNPDFCPYCGHKEFTRVIVIDLYNPVRFECNNCKRWLD